MSVSAWLLLTRNQLWGFLREPAASGFNLLVPFFIVVVQGVAYGDTAAKGLRDTRVADVLPVSAATMFVMIIGVFGMGIGLASMIEARSVAAYRLRPGGVPGLLSAYAVVLVLLVVLGFALSWLTLTVGWDARGPARAWALLPALVLGSAFFVALGALGGTLGGSPRSAQALSSMLFFPVLFLSGAMFPLDDFPRALRVVSTVLPGRHVFDLFSWTWVSGEAVPWGSIAYLVVGAAVLFRAAVVALGRRENV